MTRSDADLVSVVVIARDEQRRLLACLRSIAAQSHSALDVVIVDDGSRDATMAIAERVAAADRRLRVLRLTGAGRAAARNVGVDAAVGDLLTFVDGDDELAPGAIAALAGSLAATGSDVAAGTVLALDERGSRPLAALPDRTATTLGRTPRLLAPATLAGRLWRRDAWDALGLRFDERLELFEDVPVVAAGLAGAAGIDTVSTPVALHRRHGRRAAATSALHVDPAVTLAAPPIDVTGEAAGADSALGHVPAAAMTATDPREDPPSGDFAGTAVRAGRAQRRLDPAVLGALVAATDIGLDALAPLRPPARRAAAAALLGGEPAAALRVFDLASPAWRAAFAAAAGGWLAQVPLRGLAGRPALERTAWALLAAGRHEALAMVLHAERSGQAPPVVRRRGRRHVGWAALHGLPRRATRLAEDDPAVRAAVVLEDLHAHGGVLELGGRARVGAGPAARVALRLVPRGAPARHLPSSPVLLRTAASGAAGEFGTTFSPAALREGNAWAAQTWDLWAEVTGPGGARRHTDAFVLPAAAHGTRFLPAGDAALIRATAGTDGRVTVAVQTRWACARRQRTALGGLLVLSGDLRLGGADPVFELRRRSDGHRRRQPLRVDRSRLPHAFEATVPLHDLAEAPVPLGGRPGDGADAQQVWEAWIVDGGGERRVALPADVPVAAWFVGDRVVSLLPTAGGDAVLVEQDRRQATAATVPEPAAPRVRLAGPA